MPLVASVISLGNCQRPEGCREYPARVAQHAAVGNSDVRPTLPQHRRIIPRPRLQRRQRCLSTCLAVFVALAALLQIFESSAMCNPSIKMSSRPRMFCARLQRPHARLARRCTPSATDDVQVLFDNRWVDATVYSQDTAHIKVNFQVDGFEYGMVTGMWRKKIKPVVKIPPVVKTPPWIRHPMKHLQGGQKLEGVVINSTHRSARINISSEVPGILTYSKMASINGAKTLTAGDKVDVWMVETPSKALKAMSDADVSNITVPLTLIDYKSIQEARSKNFWMQAVVTGFDSEDDVYVSVPLLNSKDGFSLTGMVPWLERKQALDEGPVPKLEVGQHVNVRVSNVDTAGGKVDFSLIPKRDPEEFERLIQKDIWFDGEVVKAGNFGLSVVAAHPESGQLIKGHVRMSELKPIPSFQQALLKQKVRVRVSGKPPKAQEQDFYFSMLPKIDFSEFRRASPDLFLNATVSGIWEGGGLFVLADPPYGSSSGPYTVAVPADQIPESASSDGHASTKSNDMGVESDATVDNVVTFHMDEGSESVAQFSLADHVRVRITDVKGSKLFGSMRDVPNAAAFKKMTDTDWLDAIVTGYQDMDVVVSVTPENGGPSEQGLVRSDEICMGFCTDPLTEVSIDEEVQVRFVNADNTGLYFSMVPKQDVQGWQKGSEVFSGIVTDVGEQGALVSIRPVDGGQPVQGRLPQKEILSAEEVISLGQHVSVLVKKVTKKTGKIELGLATVRDIRNAEAASASLKPTYAETGPASNSTQLDDPSCIDNGLPDADEFVTAKLKMQTDYGLFLEIFAEGNVCRCLLSTSEMTCTVEEAAELAKNSQLKVRLLKGPTDKSQKPRVTMKA